jgi:hypothetical protein
VVALQLNEAGFYDLPPAQPGASARLKGKSRHPQFRRSGSVPGLIKFLAIGLVPEFRQWRLISAVEVLGR